MTAVARSAPTRTAVRSAVASPHRTAPPVLMFGIGSAKCGTIWLHDYLAAHPDCQLRKLKQLHYFDTLEARKFDWLLHELQSRIDRRQRTVAAAAGAGLGGLMAEIVDTRDYLALMMRRSDDRVGYLRYLAQSLGDRTLMADITPSYGLLSEAALRGMAETVADTRFVYLIRDPVERLWSHVRMDAIRVFRQSGDHAAFSCRYMADLLAGVETAPRRPIEYSDYAAVITKLRAAIPAEKVLVMFTEEMFTPPGIRRLCRFLGIRPVVAGLERRSNAGREIAMPANLRAAALRALRPQYDFVAQSFPVLPDPWKRTMDEGFA